MTKKIDKPAFPTSDDCNYKGLTKLEYALIHSAWEPSKDDIQREIDKDRRANPYNDSYKPKLRSYEEIKKDLKISYFSELLNF